MSKNFSVRQNAAKEFARSISSTRKEQMGDIQTLKDFISSSTGELTLDDRKIIAEQALILLERSYAHLPLKRQCMQLTRYRD